MDGDISDAKKSYEYQRKEQTQKKNYQQQTGRCERIGAYMEF